MTKLDQLERYIKDTTWYFVGMPDPPSTGFFMKDYLIFRYIEREFEGIIWC